MEPPPKKLCIATELSKESLTLPNCIIREVELRLFELDKILEKKRSAKKELTKSRLDLATLEEKREWPACYSKFGERGDTEYLEKTIDARIVMALKSNVEGSPLSRVTNATTFGQAKWLLGLACVRQMIQLDIEMQLMKVAAIDQESANVVESTLAAILDIIVDNLKKLEDKGAVIPNEWMNKDRYKKAVRAIIDSKLIAYMDKVGQPMMTKEKNEDKATKLKNEVKQTLAKMTPQESFKAAVRAEVALMMNSKGKGKGKMTGKTKEEKEGLKRMNTILRPPPGLTIDSADLYNMKMEKDGLEEMGDLSAYDSVLEMHGQPKGKGKGKGKGNNGKGKGKGNNGKGKGQPNKGKGKGKGKDGEKKGKGKGKQAKSDGKSGPKGKGKGKAKGKGKGNGKGKSKGKEPKNWRPRQQGWGW